jgi:hypothetical protein
MSSPSVVSGTSSCAREWLNPIVPCSDGTKDEDRGESYD